MSQDDTPAVSAPVIKLSNDGMITAIHELGVDGGVGLEFLSNPIPEAVKGHYLLLPNVSGLLQIYNTSVVSLNSTVVVTRLSTPSLCDGSYI
jgi:hypothetical protein